MTFFTGCKCGWDGFHTDNQIEDAGLLVRKKSPTVTQYLCPKCETVLLTKTVLAKDDGEDFGVVH